jgi:hypothetical protein
MIRKFIKLSLIISTVLFVMLVLGYGLNHNRNFDYYALSQEVLVLLTMTIEYWTTFITTFDYSGTTNLIIVGGTAFGVFIGLIALIRSLIIRRPLSGFIAFLAAIDLFVLGVSLVIINPDFPRSRFIWVLVDGFNTDFNDTLLKGGILGFLFISLFLIFVLGLTVNRRVRIKVITTSKVEYSTPTFQPSLQPATVTPNPNASTSNDTLSDLVKAMMQEELNLMRNTQQIYPNQGLNQPNQSNPYANNIDVQMIRRIVGEEIAKSHGQFISRADVQALIAQEVSMIKSQLKLK